MHAAAVDPCPGDQNGDRRVTVAELVQAVNAALEGCGGQATPTTTPVRTPTVPSGLSCPVPFTGNNLGDLDPVCVFRTSDVAPAPCDGASVRIFTDGELMIVRVGSSTVQFVGARVIDATTASVFGYWQNADLSDFVELFPSNITMRGTAHGSERGLVTYSLPVGPTCRRVTAYSEARESPESRNQIRLMLDLLHDR